MKWREALGVLCDKKIPIILKGEFAVNVLRPTVLFGTEYWALNRKIEQIMSVIRLYGRVEQL